MAADGLLAIFFFVAGLELKREFVAGDLRDPRLAALPIAAALGGAAIPAGLYFAIDLGGSSSHHDRTRRCASTVNRPSGTKASSSGTGERSLV